eukprot:gene11644-8028_t
MSHYRRTLNLYLKKKEKKMNAYSNSKGNEVHRLALPSIVFASFCNRGVALRFHILLKYLHQTTSLSPSFLFFSLQNNNKTELKYQHLQHT